MIPTAMIPTPSKENPLSYIGCIISQRYLSGRTLSCGHDLSENTGSGAFALTTGLGVTLPDVVVTTLQYTD
jgi:hypothetical protein